MPSVDFVLVLVGVVFVDCNGNLLVDPPRRCSVSRCTLPLQSTKTTRTRTRTKATLTLWAAASSQTCRGCTRGRRTEQCARPRFAPLDAWHTAGMSRAVMHELPIVVAVGDPAGIGPEVSVRSALKFAASVPVVLFGDAEQLAALAAREQRTLLPLDGTRIPLLPLGQIGVVDTGRVAPEI